MIRREARDPGRGGVQDQGRHLGLVDQRRARDDVGRVDEAGEQVDVLAHDQLLHRGLGDIAARGLGVALDQLDLVLAELGLAFLLHVQVHGALDLLRELGAAAGIGHDHADLHGLRRRQGRRHGHQSRGHPCLVVAISQVLRCARAIHPSGLLRRLRLHHLYPKSARGPNRIGGSADGWRQGARGSPRRQAGGFTSSKET